MRMLKLKSLQDPKRVMIEYGTKSPEKRERHAPADRASS